MSVVGNNRVGIPIVVLHDAEGAIIEVETKKGEHVRGLLFEAEDMGNLYMKNVVITGIDGVKRKTNQVYIRGCEIILIVLPEMLQHAPMFKRIKHWRKHGGAPPEGVGQAVGQAAAILRKAQERRQRGGFGGRGGPGAGGFASRGGGGAAGAGAGGFGGGRGGARGGFGGGGRGPPPPGMGRGGPPPGAGGGYGAPGQYGPPR